MYIIYLALVATLNAVILPPGYLINKYQDTRQGISSLTLKQQVIAGEDQFTFSETLWYKSADKFRIYVEKDNDAILFIREGTSCVAITASSLVIAEDLCSGFNDNFYYNIVIPHGSFSNYIRSQKINYPYESIELNRPGKNYKDPEGSFLLRFDTMPIYVLGITPQIYKSALNSVKSKKPGKLGNSLLDEIKNESPQIWINKSDFTPVRIFGKSSKRGEIEIMMQSYKKDINEVPYPASIDISYDGKKALTYGIREFETKKELNDQLFNVEYYKKKFSKTIEEAKLDDNKTRLLDYLKEYR